MKNISHIYSFDRIAWEERYQNSKALISKTPNADFIEKIL